MNKKIMVAMSGGVDSAASAYLVLKSGYDAVGATVKMFDKCDHRFFLNTPDDPDADINDAKKVAELIGIEHIVLDYSRDFAEEVLSDFITSYLNGTTPNPCIVCNKKIKFGKLLDASIDMGFDKIATGHYAVTAQDENGHYILRRAADKQKDQTYVLWSLTQKQLSHTLFPLGNYEKSEVREIAGSLGFVNAKKQDSQDICFIPDGDYASFISRYTGQKFEGGNYIDRNGNILGKHLGAVHYTIGQRKGLGIALGQPMYVCAKSMEQNTVTLGLDRDLFSSSLDAKDINFIPFDNLSSPLKVEAKVRYSQSTSTAILEQTGNNSFHLEFDSPQRAITPGQSVVLYDGDVVIGGGIIQ